MSMNNIGLKTARGSGTSGYIQKSAASRRAPALGVYERRKNTEEREVRSRQKFESTNISDRNLDEGVLKHEQKRYIEVKCYEMRAQLEDEGVDESDIEEQINALKDKLRNEQEEGSSTKKVNSIIMPLSKDRENRLAQTALQEFQPDQRFKSGLTRSDGRWSRDRHGAKREHERRESRPDRVVKRSGYRSVDREASPSDKLDSKVHRSREPSDISESQGQSSSSEKAEYLRKDPRSKSLKSYY